jgi:HAD superfamily hydrolase (TIGR01490 family)
MGLTALTGAALFVGMSRLQADAHIAKPAAHVSDCISEVRKLPPARKDGKRVAAFFDVDGTLWRAFKADPTGAATALVHLFGIRYKHSKVQFAMLSFLMLPILAGMAACDMTDRTLSMFLMSTLQFTGVPVQTVNDYTAELIRSKWFAEMIVKNAFVRLQEHIALGHLVVLVSATPIQVTSPLAEYFGAHVACGSVCEKSHSGTPRFERAQYKNQLLVGDAKVLMLADLVGRYDIVLEQSYAYGDHVTDVPMLEEVRLRTNHACSASAVVELACLLSVSTSTSCLLAPLPLASIFLTSPV